MKSLTAEWLAKAEEDFSVAAGLARRRKVPADSICFHCQQAVQGQRVLTACSRKDLEHVVVVPTAGAAFHGDAVFPGMLLQH